MAQNIIFCDKENSTSTNDENVNTQEDQAPSPLSSQTENTVPLQDASNNRSPLDLSTLCRLNGSKDEALFSVSIQLHDDKYIKLWQCKFCGKEFTHYYTLLRHLPTHTDERKFQCKICGKAFRQMSTLSQHRAIHSIARPFICEICQKTFNRVSTLISHRKTHTGIKPHQCHICNKAFHQKGNLRNHIYTHTNARPYKCHECGKGYNQMSNLRCHQMKLHRDTEKSKYCCDTCAQYFHKRADLRKHEQTEHETNNVLFVGKNLKDEHKNMNAIFVEPIRTKAMQEAIESNQIPFALLKPLNGMAVLVRVLPVGDKQMLIPASADDLKENGTISVIPNIESTDDESDSNTKSSTVKIKIPVVATVIQENTDSGEISLSVVSPGPHESSDVITSIEESISDTSLESRKCIVKDGAVVISKNENLH